MNSCSIRRVKPEAPVSHKPAHANEEPGTLSAWCRERRGLTLLLLVLAAMVVGERDAAAQTDVYLRLQRAGVIRVNLTLADLAPHGRDLVVREVAHMTREIVKNDLLFSGLFEIKELGRQGPTGEQELQKLLGHLNEDGQDAFLAGTISGSGQELTIEASLYDAATGRLISQETISASRDRLRFGAHTLADRLTLLLAGERGIARTQLAFVSTRTGSKELYVMDYDGHGVRPLTHNGSINMSPAWIPGPERLTFVSFISGNADIYLLDLRHPQLEPLAHHPGLDSSPTPSPDGDRIAFTLAVDGNPDIYVASLEEGVLTDLGRLTRHWGVDCCPTWSPGGLELAFVSDRSGTPQIYLMEADGTNIRRLTFKGDYNTSPAWSPRGDRIAFASRMDGNFDIFTVRPTGFGLERLTYGSGSNESPSWSPDGRHLAVSSTREGGSSIFVLSEGGARVRRLSTGRGEDFSPAWSSRPASGEDEVLWSPAGGSESPWVEP